MTKRELLEQYRLLVIDIKVLDKQSAFLDGFIGGPRPIRGVQLTGMPRGTNDPVAAMIQREDVDETIIKLDERAEELRGLVGEVERIIDDIPDRRTQIIIRAYYATGWTDELIADQLELSRQHVNRLRLAYLEELDREDGVVYVPTDDRD